MQPEISHRCPSCGASVRDRDALFCPECGKTLSEKSTEPKASEAVEPLTSSPQPEEGEAPDLASDVAPDAEVDEPSSSAQPAIAETSAATVNPKDDEPATAV